MSLPSFPALLATSNAAHVAAPADMPTSSPSLLASSRAVWNASSSLTLMISSMRLVWRTSGMNPAPMPWILCGPFVPPLRTGEAAGSTAMALNVGFSGLMCWATPVMVPPVPTPEISMSIFPFVAFQISGPVVSLWIFGLAWFLNCCGMKELGFCLASSSAFLMAPFIPSVPGVRTSSAPYALSSVLLSVLMVSGMVRMRW